MIDEEVRRALLVEVHRLIEVCSSGAVRAITTGKAPAYPPAGGPEGEAGLTTEERDALLSLSLSPAAKSGVRKVIADAIAEAFFGAFCVADGVGDPRNWQGKTWLGVDLSAPVKGQDRPMLHDDFYETYWSYVENRDSA